MAFQYFFREANKVVQVSLIYLNLIHSGQVLLAVEDEAGLVPTIKMWFQTLRINQVIKLGTIDSAYWGDNPLSLDQATLFFYNELGEVT